MLAGQIGAHGRIRTCTFDALDVVPLLVGLHELLQTRMDDGEWRMACRAPAFAIINLPSFIIVFRNWRNAVDLHHLPEGMHSLAPRPGSLVRWTFQIGPRGRTSTCNLSVLSGTSLLIGLHAVGAHGRICTDTVRVLSAPSLHWTTWAKLVAREGFAPSTFPF